MRDIGSVLMSINRSKVDMSICFFKDFELKYFDVKGSVEFQQEDQGPVLQSWIRGLERQPGLTLGFQCHNSGSLSTGVYRHGNLC